MPALAWAQRWVPWQQPQGEHRGTRRDQEEPWPWCCGWVGLSIPRARDVGPSHSTELLCCPARFTKAAFFSLFFFLQRKWLDFLSARPHLQCAQQETCETSRNSPVEFGTEQTENKAEQLQMLQASLLGAAGLPCGLCCGCWGRVEVWQERACAGC